MSARPIDLDMLAYDISDLFDRNDYGMDVGMYNIRAALPDFLAALGVETRTPKATGRRAPRRTDLTPDPRGDL